MAKISGKDLYIEFDGTNVSDSIRNLDISEAQETADATAGADDYRNYVQTTKTIEASFEVVMKDYSNGGSAIRALFSPGALGTLIWGVEGTASGKPKKGFYARLTDVSEAIPFDDVNTFSVTAQMAGTALAFDGVTDTW